MRVLEVIPSFEPLGGAENFVFNLSLALKTCVEVYVVSLYDDENIYVSNCFRRNGIEIIYLNKKEGFDFKCSLLFRKVLKRIKPDVVHLHLNTYITAFIPIIFRKSAFIYTFHTFISDATYGNKFKPSNLLIKFLIKHEYMKAVTISDTVDDSYKDYFGGLESTIIYNGIDISKYVYIPQKLKKYDFISVGSFNDIKNNFFMIKAVEKTISEGFDINYIVLGDGKNYESCKKYCEEHHLDDRIHLIGRVNNVEEYMSESKCLLLASHWEGNPLVVNEAIASGIWVIANDVGGVKDLIDDTCGYLVQPESESDFLDKMKTFLYNSDDIRKRIVPENIENNRRKVDLNNICKQYLDLMDISM